jgi:hypothetical protein
MDIARRGREVVVGADAGAMRRARASNFARRTAFSLEEIKISSACSVRKRTVRSALRPSVSLTGWLHRGVV